MIDDLGGEPAVVHVVRGEPDDVELAALVAGLAAAGAEAGDDDPTATHPHTAWSDRSRAMRGRTGPRTPTAPGADSWRWSLRA
ncbi:acyl-CoA carboxylase epsilon subunit [Pengzhenrongella frigida]|uniref:acyl-CoA carboxylase epsilon subunit n=1 Tax=Pengzhenrongella frigida TaxID=1259133 RepID=UPI001F5D4FA7|nr:acyl-CoA carboxylase epsilon subunit [Cellulomonas sp. HLT2-17]